MDVDSEVLYGDLLPPPAFEEEDELLLEEYKDCLSGCSTINEKLNSISFDDSPPRLNWVTEERSSTPPPSVPPPPSSSSASSASSASSSTPPRTPENQPIPDVHPDAPERKKQRSSPPPTKRRRLVTTDLKSTVTVVRTPEEEAAEERRKRHYLREKKEYEEGVRRRQHRREQRHHRDDEDRCRRRRGRRSSPRRGPATQPSKPFPKGAPASYPPGVVGGIFRQARNRCVDKFQRVFSRWKKDRHCLAFTTSADRTVSFITLLDGFSKANPDVPFEQSADSALCLSMLFSSLWDETESRRSADARPLSVPQRMVRFIEETYNKC